MNDINNDLLNNQISSNKLSHAYLFETDYSLENIDYIFNFIKNIFTKDKNEEETVIINKRINDGNFPELKIIKREGQFIKKDQILSLKEEFSKSSQESNVRVYVIYDADKMNDSSANTLLKFLEEPDGLIIGILLTNNIHSVLQTLISRCQIISLPKNSSITLSNNYDLITKLLYDIEYSGINIYNNISDYELLFSTKENMDDTLKSILMIYDDILYNKINNSYKYITPTNYITLINQKNNMYSLANKINIVSELIDKNKYNVNLQLLFDNLIILMIGGDINDSTS